MGTTVHIAFGNERVPTSGAGVGGCIDVARRGQCLYALQNRSMVVLDLADSDAPRPLGALANLGNLRQIVVRGTTAFITAREDGLFIVDVSDPEQPRLIAHHDTIEFATGIDICDGVAFVACRWFGVEIVDVSDPALPRHMSIMRVGEAQSCEVSDGFLYVGAWEERRVAICDVRNPAAPRQVATVPLGGRGDGVRVHNGILYAATGHHRRGASLGVEDPRYGAGNGMDIFDVSEPARPRQLSRVQFDWRFYYGWPDTWRVELAYPHAYLCHTYNGIFVLDVSNPAAPGELGQIRIPLYPGDPGYRELKTESPHGRRQPILPFDPKEKLYSPVCGLAIDDGCLYVAALFSDLHVFRDAELVCSLAFVNTGSSLESGGPPPWLHARHTVEDDRSPEPSQVTPSDMAAGTSRQKPSLVRFAASETVATSPLCAVGDFHEPDLPFLQQALSPIAERVAHYRPFGQVYAAAEYGGLVYAACGSAGVHVLDQDLRLLNTCASAGFAMDLQINGGRLYVAESSGGLACYQIDGSGLERVHTYVCQSPVRQVRVSADGRVAVIQAGGSAYEALRLDSTAPPELMRTERGTGGLIYYRQLCNGFIDGRFICGTWCAGRTFMLDLVGDDPEPLPDVTGVLPDMETGGYCPCGSYALLTRNGGYSFYLPGFGGDYEALPVHRIEGGPDFYGKPTCHGGLLAVCNRIGGDVTLVDISCLSKPKLLCRFRLSGSPDCASIGEETLLIPAGYQGLFRAAFSGRID
ncbi:MAG: hypothetical protein HN742_10420 [Lentisphaerae bacterium]|nr:hypothetical protein [Lentisphaerota bacterium]MBT5611373.1 hypothetical protein [Lentisphaerota bacterium]MBT7062312.1 hypothetical protein [Lentisphaerota bacterium]MBT7842278.1 hypothetical protein [Lentisphaerota bacterium]